MLTREQQIAQHALTILVNLAADGEILENLATDDKFLSVIFARIVVRNLRGPTVRLRNWQPKHAND